MQKTSTHDLNQQIKSTIYALTFPTVGHPMWLSAIPDEFKDKAQIIRMIQLMKDPDSFLVYSTDEEAMIYIMTASLVEPTSHNWAHIYEYLTRKYMLGWHKKKPEELPDFLKDEINLDDYEKGLLKDLKRWIRKKQIEHVKFMEKQNKKAHSVIPSKPQKNLIDWV
jgi:hypothetical protein